MVFGSSLTQKLCTLMTVRDKHLKAAEAPEGQGSTFYSQPVITHAHAGACRGAQSAACNCFPAVETETYDASSQEAIKRRRHKKFVVRRLQVQQ